MYIKKRININTQTGKSKPPEYYKNFVKLAGLNLDVCLPASRVTPKTPISSELRGAMYIKQTVRIHNMPLLSSSILHSDDLISVVFQKEISYPVGLFIVVSQSRSKIRKDSNVYCSYRLLLVLIFKREIFIWTKTVKCSLPPSPAPSSLIKFRRRI